MPRPWVEVGIVRTEPVEDVGEVLADVVVPFMPGGHAALILLRGREYRLAFSENANAWIVYVR